ncbi:hypothetical protein IWX78_000403 [Mycetocola sp. CAN_C7]|uniref:hypothetical protein n=1 Tax=Mycetocola sp. CAN_C7 TaxID=2787724 RepID=UPI0018CABB63
MFANRPESGTSKPPIVVRAKTALGFDDPRLAGLLALLWLTTGCYLVLHFTHRFIGVPWSPLFDLGSERGYGEVFFQMLTGWSILLLLAASVRLRAGIVAVFAAATTYLLIDDYFMIHEAFGTWFATSVMYVGSISSHIGEAVWLALVGVILLVSLAVAYRRSRREIRRISLVLAGIFAALVFFGIAVDVLHSPFIDMPVVDPLFIALEDGGEIAVMSVLAVYLLSLAFPAGTATTAVPGRADRSA